jgi:hypothetical protein
MRKVVVTLMLISAAMTRCGRAEVTVEQAMQSARIRYDKILEVADLDQDHRLVFYRNDQHLELGWLDCARNICRWIDGARETRGTGIVSASYRRIADSWPIFIGEVRDTRVNRVEVRTGDAVYEAIIIPLTDAARYWYVIPDKPKGLYSEIVFCQDAEAVYRLQGMY